MHGTSVGYENRLTMWLMHWWVGLNTRIRNLQELISVPSIDTRSIVT